MEKPELAARPFGPIYDRIGPIVDPAFLKILNEEQLKSIVLTVAKAEHAAVMVHAQALQDVVNIVEKVQVRVAGK
jgi:hypothetical protein